MNHVEGTSVQKGGHARPMSGLHGCPSLFLLALVDARSLVWWVRLWAPIVLCALLIGGPSCAVAAQEPRGASTDATNPRAQRLLIQGMTETQLGDHEEAISYFEAALEQAPESPVLLRALADAYDAQGDLSTALFHAQQAHRNGASRPDYARRLTEMQRAVGEPAAALRTYESLLGQFPDCDDAYRARATLQAELGRTEAAIQSYEAYLDRVELPPIDVYRRLLPLYRETEDEDGIEETLRTLVDRRPTMPTYQRRLGNYYADRERPRKALGLLAPLGRRHPNDDSLQQQVQRLARHAGRTTALPPKEQPPDPLGSQPSSTEAALRRAQSVYDTATMSSPPDTARLRAAADLLRDALRQSPDSEAVLSLQAQLYESWGRPEQAGQAMEQLLELAPRAPDRWVRAAKTYYRARRDVQAAELAEEGGRLFPGHMPLARIAAFALLRSGTPGQAREHFQSALSLLDDSMPPHEEAVLLAGLGLANSRLGQPQDADDALENALALAPDHPDMLRLYAQSLAHRGERLDRALDLAEQAVGHAPDSPPAHHALGQVHLQRNELDAARRHLRIALDTAPPSAPLLERLGDVEKALGNDAAAQTYWQRAAKRAPDRASLREKLADPANS